MKKAGKKYLYENITNKVKSKYILKLIFDHLQKCKLLSIIKYNKNIQNRIDISLIDYKKFLQIEIKVYPSKFIAKYNSNLEIN